MGPGLQHRPLTGTPGAEPADRILPDWLPPKPGADQPANPYPGLELRAIGDALISFGRCSRLRTTRFSRAQYREPAYRAELNRRSRILTPAGHHPVARPEFRPPTDVRGDRGGDHRGH